MTEENIIYTLPLDVLQNHITAQDLTRVCRLCMGCSDTMTDIFFALSPDQLSVGDFVMQHVPIQIEKDDNLPSLVCSVCVEKINAIQEFQKLCLHSDKVLRNELQGMLSTNTPQLSIVPISQLIAGSTMAVVPPDDTQREVAADDIIIIRDEESTDQDMQVLTGSPEVIALDDEVHPMVSNEVNSVAEPAAKKVRRTSENNNAEANVAGPTFQFVEVGDSDVVEVFEDDEYCQDCHAPLLFTTRQSHLAMCMKNARDCPFCYVKDLKLMDFDKHIQETHIKEFNTCPNCHRLFLENAEFEKHDCGDDTPENLDVNEYHCGSCTKSFANLKAFTCHYYNNHYQKYKHKYRRT